MVEDATTVIAHLAGKEYPAKVIALDSRHDLALLRIEVDRMPHFRPPMPGRSPYSRHRSYPYPGFMEPESEVNSAEEASSAGGLSKFRPNE